MTPGLLLPYCSLLVAPQTQANEVSSAWRVQRSTASPLGLRTALLPQASASVAESSISPFSTPIEAVPESNAPRLAQANPVLPSLDGASPSLEPLPEAEPLPVLPDPEELLAPGDAEPPANPLPTTEEAVVVVRQFEVVGSTVFTEADFDAITAEYRDRPLSFSDISQVRDAITQLYIDNGYITSGVIIPPQAIQNGVARFQAVEGSVEDIQIEGSDRLSPSYIRGRLSLATGAPLNVNRLLERLQLLRLDPLVETLSADLQAGTRAGSNLLTVSVVEAKTVDLDLTLDNDRAPTVGSLQQQLILDERNLSGVGDRLRLSYSRTNGSQSGNASYTLPVNARDGAVTVSFGRTGSEILDDEFDVLDISSDATVAELTFRQPVIKTPRQELGLGIVASHQRSQTFLGLNDIGGFPLSAGADEEGRTRVSALRFFQDWTQRSPRQVIALRSQFNLGIDVLDATNNSNDVPDSQFFSWRGQGQWIRLLKPAMPLVVRGSAQLSPSPLLSQERYSLGGQSTVRGYRQNELLTDNGVALSAEVRFPLWRDRANNNLLQIAPFIEGGRGWNNRGPDPETSTLLSLGTGLLLQLQDDFNFRLDWGIPLTDRSSGDSLQENGVHFSASYSFF